MDSPVTLLSNVPWNGMLQDSIDVLPAGSYYKIPSHADFLFAFSTVPGTDGDVHPNKVFLKLRLVKEMLLFRLCLLEK